jgi:hypothetical protein
MSAGSIYDSQSGGKKPRYSIAGRVVEGTIVDQDGRDVVSNGTGSTAGMNLDDLLAGLREATGMPAPQGQGSRTSIADAIARSRQIQDAEAKFPNPGNADLKPRYTGITRKPDPRDQARVDAAKANRDLAILETDMVNLIVRYVVSGKLYIMEAITQLISMDAAYPASVRPFGQFLSEWGIELIIEAFKQGGEQQAILMLEEIARAATYRW